MVVMLLTVLALSVVTVAIHEAGHAAAATLLRLPVALVVGRFMVGVKIGADGSVLTRRESAIVALGGPAANALLVVLAIRLGFGMLAFLNLVALLNLLPFKRFDGYLLLHGHRP